MGMRGLAERLFERGDDDHRFHATILCVGGDGQVHRRHATGHHRHAGHLLAEATFALPGHLSHEDHEPRTMVDKFWYTWSRMLRPLEIFFERLSVYLNAGLDRFGQFVYLPLLKFCFRYPAMPAAVTVFVVCLAIGMFRSGVVPFEFFPDLDGRTLIAQVIYPDGTPVAVTKEAAQRMEAAARRVSERIAAEEEAAGPHELRLLNRPTTRAGQSS